MESANSVVGKKSILARIVVIWSVAFIAIFPWANKIYGILASPLWFDILPEGTLAVDTITPYFVPMKMAILVATVLSVAPITYFVCNRLMPNSHPHKKESIAALSVTSLVLLVLGLLFAHSVYIPIAINSVVWFMPDGKHLLVDISKYSTFVSLRLLGSGLIFETPVFISIAVATGVLNVHQLKEARPYVAVCSFIASAIIIPIPILAFKTVLETGFILWALFELGVLVATLVTKDAERKLHGSNY